MATINKYIHVTKTADEAWSLLSDVGRINALLPSIESCTTDGNIRTCAMKNGSTTVERIDSIDENTKSISCSILESSVNFDYHRAKMMVLDDADGAKIVWNIEIRPDSLAISLDDLFQKMLEDIAHSINRHS